MHIFKCLWNKLSFKLLHVFTYSMLTRPYFPRKQQAARLAPPWAWASLALKSLKPAILGGSMDQRLGKSPSNRYFRYLSQRSKAPFIGKFHEISIATFDIQRVDDDDRNCGSWLSFETPTWQIHEWEAPHDPPNMRLTCCHGHVFHVQIGCWWFV